MELDLTMTKESAYFFIKTHSPRVLFNSIESKGKKSRQCTGKKNLRLSRLDPVVNVWWLSLLLPRVVLEVAEITTQKLYFSCWADDVSCNRTIWIFIRCTERERNPSHTILHGQYWRWVVRGTHKFWSNGCDKIFQGEVLILHLSWYSKS